MKSLSECANYCLNCKLKPCSVKGCPMQTKIPEFIMEVKNENYENAYKILQENNIFSYICSLICPQEEQCEGSCIRGIKSEPTNIGILEKFVNEWAIENKIEYKFSKKEKNGKKVAVIGSGPAGLECSLELLKNGFDVDIYEKDNTPGGILIYGIPDFRLSKKHVNEIIEMLQKLGVKFELGKELGKNLHIEDLKKEYDAIFLGIGAEVPSKYDLGDFEQIYDADYFLKMYNNNKKIENLGNVVVIGGGNVAMDCSRAAVRMGAESVSILYRRDAENMPARKIELEEAIEDGVKPVFTTRVIKAEGKNRKIEKLQCIKTQVIDGKAIDLPDGEFEYKADTVVFAIGLKPNKDILEKEKLEYNERGLISINDKCETNIEKVYAGGDLSEAKSTVCRALGSSRKAAQAIMERLGKNV